MSDFTYANTINGKDYSNQAITSFTIQNVTETLENNVSLTQTASVMAFGIFASKDEEKIQELKSHPRFKTGGDLHGYRNAITRAKKCYDNLESLGYTYTQAVTWTLETFPFSIASASEKLRMAPTKTTDSVKQAINFAVKSDSIETGGQTASQIIKALSSPIPALKQVAEDILQEARQAMVMDTLQKTLPVLSKDTAPIVMTIVKGYLQQLAEQFPELLTELQEYQLDLLTSDTEKAEQILAA